MDAPNKMMLAIFIVMSMMTSSLCQKPRRWTVVEETPEFWMNKGQEELKVALENQLLNKEVAKNIILFVGDGMGIPTMNAGRILKGQLRGQTGEEYVMAMDKLPHVGLAKTYTVDKQVPDSSSTATAIVSGVKSKYQTLGLSGKVVRDNCRSAAGNEVTSILDDFYGAGRSTGLITTTRLVHATPAAAYAHSASRYWYTDADLPQNAKDIGCKDIAQQFYDNSHKFTVALGGGRKYFRPNTTRDPEDPALFNSRQDGQDLIKKWQDGGAGETRSYVWNKQQFDTVIPMTTDRLLGIFEHSDMKYEADRARVNDEPSIAEMTEKAIQMLQKNSKGYFLFVEGGRIDHGHHLNNAYSALHDVVALDDAVDRAMKMTSETDTLIIVTADHAHTMSLGGNTDRGDPIFGLSPELGRDQKPYTSIQYTNGPGFQGGASYATIQVNPNAPLVRENLTLVNTASRHYVQQSASPAEFETHTAEDVAILARGPMAHLFNGVHEQSYIAHAMRYASCLGSNRGHCAWPAPDIFEKVELDKPSNFMGYELTPEKATLGLMGQFAINVVLIALVGFLATKMAIDKVRKGKEESDPEAGVTGGQGCDDGVNGGQDVGVTGGEGNDVGVNGGEVTAVAGKIPGVGAVAEKIPGVGDLAGKIPGAGDLAGKLPGVGAVGEKIPGVGDLAGKIPEVGDLAGKIPGVGSLAEKIPGVGNLTEKIPGVGDIAGKIPGVGNLAEKIPGVGDLAGKIPGVGDLSGKIPGVGNLTEKIPGVGDLAGKIPGVGNLAEKIPGVGDLAGKIPGVGSLAEKIPGVGDLAGKIPGSGNLIDKVGDVVSKIPGADAIVPKSFQV